MGAFRILKDTQLLHLLDLLSRPYLEVVGIKGRLLWDKILEFVENQHFVFSKDKVYVQCNYIYIRHEQLRLFNSLKKKEKKELKVE